ncbi:MAG: hypothetical protein ACYC27_01610 [Armatimonadota bacterium]
MRIIITSRQIYLICSIILCCLYLPKIVFATSAQNELSEPVLTANDSKGNGQAFFGTALSDDIYNTAGSLGATFRTGRIGPGKLYFFGDIFSWINTTHSEFKPQRVIYTLEPGYFYVSEKSTYRFFIKHQSYHDVDFTDNIDESYELYGLSYKYSANPEYYLRIGKYMNRKDVDYNWDFAGYVRFYLDDSTNVNPYLHLWLHQVTESDNSTDRNGFTDYAIEAGYEWKSGLTIFARYELLNDLNRFNGNSDHHILFGPKYMF